MSPPLNEKRMSVVNPSATLEMSRKAKALKASGVDVAVLSAGEPDFPTPECILDAADKAARNGATRYTPARGTADLVDAMQTKLKRDQGVDYAENEVISTVGTKGAVSLAFDATIGEGDEVIIFAPYWVTYPTLVKLAGGVPVVVETKREGGYQPSAEALKAAITPRTRGVMLNSPNNPTGAAYTEETLRALLSVLEGTDIWVYSDEIYERLQYGGEHVSTAQLSADARERTIYLGGVAKAYAMTGWRLGVAAGPSSVVDAMILLQQQRASCAPAISQAAGAYAMREPPEVLAALDEMRVAFTRRRSAALEQLGRIDGVQVSPPGGSFYLFVDVSERLPAKIDGEAIADDMALATRLLEESHVAVVPGSPFGAPGSFRMSFAAADDTIEKGIDRIARFLDRAKAS